MQQKKPLSNSISLAAAFLILLTSCEEQPTSGYCPPRVYADEAVKDWVRAGKFPDEVHTWLDKIATQQKEIGKHCGG
jgi:hypothetical protein